MKYDSILDPPIDFLERKLNPILSYHIEELF